MRTGCPLQGLNGRVTTPITPLHFPTRPHGLYTLLSYYLESGNLAEDWDSSVGIQTYYGLDGPGIETTWKRGHPRLVRWLTRPLVKWAPGLFSGYKATGWLLPPTLHRTEVK